MGKNQKSDYTRKNPSERQTIQHEKRSKWKSINIGVYAQNHEYKIYAQTTREQQTIQQKHSTISKNHEVQLFDTALPVEDTNNHGVQLCKTLLSVENNTKKPGPSGDFI